MRGLYMILWGAIDWLQSIAHDREQKWRLECPYCDRSHVSRSYNMVLLKNSLHHHFSDGDAHPSSEEMPQETWEDNPAVEPELTAGSTHIPDDEYR